MKVVTLEDKVVIYLHKKEIEDINDYIKKLILKLRKQYGIKIFGFYQINVYKNLNVGIIIEIIREDSVDYFDDFLDLKVKIYDNSDVYAIFNDYFLDIKRDIKVLNHNYYIDVNTLSYKEFLLMTEFCDYVYGTELDKIRSK